MKVLHALQGTENGHVARALEIILILKRKVDRDVLISGTQEDIDPGQVVKYKLYGNIPIIKRFPSEEKPPHWQLNFHRAQTHQNWRLFQTVNPSDPYLPETIGNF